MQAQQESPERLNLDLFRSERAKRQPPALGRLRLNLTGKRGRSSNIKEVRFKEQKGICNGCRKAFSFDDLEVDHIVAESCGGPDTDENIQLLCGPCNRIKGDRGMVYLKLRLSRPDFAL